MLLPATDIIASSLQIKIGTSAYRDYTKGRCTPQVNSTSSATEQGIARTPTRDSYCRRQLGDYAFACVVKRH